MAAARQHTGTGRLSRLVPERRHGRRANASSAEPCGQQRAGPCFGAATCAGDLLAPCTWLHQSMLQPRRGAHAADDSPAKDKIIASRTGKRSALPATHNKMRARTSAADLYSQSTRPTPLVERNTSFTPRRLTRAPPRPALPVSERSAPRSAGQAAPLAPEGPLPAKRLEARRGG